MKEDLFSSFSEKPHGRFNFTAVSSGGAWQYIIEHFDFLDELNGLGDREVSRLLFRKVSEAENRLTSMRRNCRDIREKLAVTLYIRQTRTFERYINRYKTYYDYNTSDEIFIPIVYNIDGLANPSRIDEWFSFVGYQTKGRVPAVRLQGEDEYIIGLIRLLNGQYHEAVCFLIVAEKNGYAVGDVKDIIDHIAKKRISGRTNYKAHQA